MIFEIRKILFAFQLFLLINENKILLNQLKNIEKFRYDLIRLSQKYHYEQTGLNKSQERNCHNYYSKHFENYCDYLLKTYGFISTNRNDYFATFHVRKAVDKG